MRVATAVSGRLDLLNDSKFSQGGDAQSASQSALGRLSHSSFARSKTSRHYSAWRRASGSLSPLSPSLSAA